MGIINQINYASLSPPNVQTQTNIQEDRHGLFALFISVLDPFGIVGFVLDFFHFRLREPGRACASPAK